MITKLFRAWRNALLSPEKIGENSFTFRQMLVVSFLLGSAYCGCKYFIYEKAGASIKEIYMPEFWIHSLWGGFAAVGFWMLASAMGFYGVRYLGRQISYQRIEHLVFASMFLWLLPPLTALLFGFELITVLEYFKMSNTLLPVMILASLMTYLIFRKAFSFNSKKSLTAAVFIVPLTYFLPKWLWAYASWEIAHLTHRMPLSLKCSIGVVYALTVALTCYAIRGRNT